MVVKMNRYLILSLLLVDMFSAFAQNYTLMKLSPAEIETAFLKQNLQLIAEHLNMDLADAAIIQAGLWDNPDVSIENINLWNNGKEKQFSIEISQLIQTARKRTKLVNREKTGKELVLLEFKTILQDIKMDLRQTIHEIAYLQSYQKTLDRQQTSLNRLIKTFRKQLANGNISKPELLRLHAALLELTGEINENAVT
jgi:cobalt-zinc-cadmium efflux system outer membrane protein